MRSQTAALDVHIEPEPDINPRHVLSFSSSWICGVIGAPEHANQYTNPMGSNHVLGSVLTPQSSKKNCNSWWGSPHMAIGSWTWKKLLLCFIS